MKDNILRIYGDRQTGKTTKLCRVAKVIGATVLCPNQAMARHVRMGLSIPCESIQQVVNNFNQVTRGHRDPILYVIDEAQMCWEDVYRLIELCEGTSNVKVIGLSIYVEGVRYD